MILCKIAQSQVDWMKKSMQRIPKDSQLDLNMDFDWVILSCFDVYDSTLDAAVCLMSFVVSEPPSQSGVLCSI